MKQNLPTEIEATFTDVDLDQVREKLSQCGAECMTKERLLRRKNYDYPDGRLDAKNGWIRLRDEGCRVTLAYKQCNDRTLTGTKEISVTVDDFDNTAVFLESIGLIQKSYQETKRESWVLDGVEVEIDTWPWIPSFVEIEGENEPVVEEVALKLGFDWGTAKHGSVENIYQEIFDVTEAEVDEWEEILFSDVPDWIEANCKK